MNNNKSSEEVVKKAGKTAARMYAGKVGEVAFDLATKTKTGKNFIQNGSNIVNNGFNNPFGKLPTRGVINNISSSNTNNDNVDTQNNLDNKNIKKDSIFNNISNGKNNTDKSVFDRIFGFNGLNGKKSKYSKLGIIITFAPVIMNFLLIVFIVLFLDVTMDKILKPLKYISNLANKALEAVGLSNGENLNIYPTFLDNVVLSKKVSEEDISMLENDIVSLNDGTCLGENISNIIQTLNDRLKRIGFIIPYVDGGRTNKIIDSNWGYYYNDNYELNINGLDNLGLILWAYNVVNLENNINAINDFREIGNEISLNDLQIGDLLVSDNDVKFVSNIDEDNITYFDMSNEGIQFFSIKKSNIVGYSFIGMSDYYLNNCSN